MDEINHFIKNHFEALCHEERIKRLDAEIARGKEVLADILAFNKKLSDLATVMEAEIIVNKRS